jgi:hypothetical protein
MINFDKVMCGLWSIAFLPGVGGRWSVVHRLSSCGLSSVVRRPLWHPISGNVFVNMI